MYVCMHVARLYMYVCMYVCMRTDVIPYLPTYIHTYHAQMMIGRDPLLLLLMMMMMMMMGGMIVRLLMMIPMSASSAISTSRRPTNIHTYIHTYSGLCGGAEGV